MNLFHGTNTKFEIIDLAKSKDKRDFGKGFYTTTFYDQAEKWAKNQYIRYGGDGSFVYFWHLHNGTGNRTIKVF